jgi:hypothetical protein
MSITQKTRKQVADAISATVIAVLDEHLPEWHGTPPGAMTANDQKIFDLVTDFERKVTQKLAQVLA